MFPLLITAGWLVAVFFGLMMCRLAALSDRSQVVALAEWVTTSYFAGSGQLRGSVRGEQRSFELPGIPRRAAG